MTTEHVPTTGYYAEIDIVNEPTAIEAVQILRCELRPLGIHVRVVALDGANGNVEVRIRSNSRKRIENWLSMNDYESPVVDARNPHAIPHAR